MRLKYLELHGYKTFASRTGFAFDGSITAIVGPNGSGKSNLADAIRWVLGEQSFRVLRGKRTEDMIFSGSAQRSRLGMASASLTLDNADGWLPVDFAEVTITRRAYRSGENEYLLNGQRVRLRDITELLARSGLARRTYTVIGQGLVDDVLSLRPEDRRALFEEAAGIALYQARRAEALTRLEETRANLLRVNDIINEIAPRLHRLEREAERTERHDLLNRQLEGLLRTWYGFLWRQEQQELRRARDALSRWEEEVTRHGQALEALGGRMADLRDRQARLRAQLGNWHRESSDLHRQMEGVQRDLAVWQERAQQLSRQGEELRSELVGLEAQAQAMAGQVSAAEEDLASRQAALQEREAQIAQAQAELAAHESRRADLSRRLAGLQARALDLATEMADRRSRLAQLGERQKVVAEERTDHQTAIAALDARAEELRAQGQEVSAQEAGLQSETAALEAEAGRLATALAGIQARQAGLQAALADARRTAERLQARYDLLTRLRQEGEGLYAGVRAVLQEAGGRGAGLRGVWGTVAQLLHVPVEYEVALEVALGGHLQDLVVESWADAEAAIAFLRRGRRGRATFLPLDTVRPAPRLTAPSEEGVVGVAADLVRAEARLAPVVEMLLGRTVVVADLKAARRVFGRLRGGFQIVTLAGELLRSGGSVTGGEGREQAQGQVLAREREWRELPAQVAAAQAHCHEIEAALAQVHSAEAQTRGQMEALAARRREVEEAVAQARARRAGLERELEQVLQQRAWREGLLARLDGETETLAALGVSLQADLERLAAGREEAERQAAALQAELDELRGEALYRRLSEVRTAAAVARGAWEHRRLALEALRERQAGLLEQAHGKHRRLSALEEEQAALEQRIAAQISQEAVIQGWLSSLARQIEPAEAEIARLEEAREQLEQEEVALRARLREAENSQAQALLTVNRHQDRLQRLRRQILDDFGLVDMEPAEGVPDQPPLPLGEIVSTLPVVETLPEGLEEEIHQLKAQIRRMGAVNPAAPDEYAEVLDRYTFLTTQAADLEEAARSLREVIAELDEVMHQEFAATFKAVAARFKENFTRLFGGGTARLLLTEPDDIGQTGVEIVAQPPGKRQQPLALLSGGERALTAVALIFSILEVNPPPFCILDEVDAMLDEANVRRFRQALESLSRHTQFIVITHNRGTIQAANTIYGISMGEDSTSQVVSLRLEGERIAAPDGTEVELEGELVQGPDSWGTVEQREDQDVNDSNGR